MDKKLKNLLEQRCRFKISNELFERFIGQTTEITLKDGEVLIPYGKVDTNFYIQKQGVLRTCYFDGDTEKTYGFSDPGAPAMSYHAHFMGQPAVIQVVSCGESVALKMTKKQLDDLINDSHEFAKWMLAIKNIQPYFNEYKFTNITGQAKERYLWMLENRPEVVARVPSKIMASYLGVSPTWLSILKRKICKGR